MTYMTPALRADARAAIRGQPWSEYHKRRARRVITDTPDGRVPRCLSCDSSDEHECFWVLLSELKLEAAADEHYCRALLASGEILDTEKTAYAGTRGPYWVSRLAADYGLVISGGHEFLFMAAAPLIRSIFSYTDPVLHVSVVNSALFEAGLDVVDLYLVHHLIHATGIPADDVHGSLFRSRFRKVYPWNEPGPVTSHDPGTPRRVLWEKAQKAVL